MDVKTPLHDLRTELHCDGTEFCPALGFQHLLAVCMYELNEETQQRSGCVQLFDVENVNSTLRACASRQCAGVLDFKWLPNVMDGKAIGASALSDSSVEILQVPAPTEDSLQQVACISDAGAGGITLSCDWDPFSDATVLASSSTGHITMNDAGTAATTLASWRAHDMEAWIVACDKHSPGVVYSGADDCTLKGWDVRDPGRPTFVNKRSHSAGVCCAQSHRTNPHWLATGSYDEHARLWDTRNMASEVSKVSVGGGVWRFKWHPTKTSLALVACMHNGFAVLQADDSSKLQLLEEYPHQKTLGYGADWSHGTSGEDLVATCSFYDNMLHLWRPNTTDTT